MLTLALLVVTAADVRAHPVSFKGGWGIMPSYASGWNDLQINYSVTSRWPCWPVKHFNQVTPLILIECDIVSALRLIQLPLYLYYLY